MSIASLMSTNSLTGLGTTRASRATALTLNLLIAAASAAILAAFMFMVFYT